MVETNELVQGNSEKPILTLKLLNNIEEKEKNLKVGIGSCSDGDSQIKIITESRNTLYAGGYLQKIKYVLFLLFLKKNTNIKNGADYNYFKYENAKTVNDLGVGVLYDYGGYKICYIDHLRFLIQSDKLIPLQGKGCISTTDDKNGIVGFECEGEIILKKFNLGKINDKSPYITIPGTRVSQLNKQSSEFFVVNEGKVDKIVLDYVDDNYDPIKYKTEKTFSFDEFGDIMQIESDQNDNFVLMIGKKNDKFSLHVLKEREWQYGEAINSIPGIKEFVVMPDNNLLGIMEDGTIKKISTTFDQFEKGYIENGGDVAMREDVVNVVKNNTHQKMLEAMDSIKLEGGEGETDVEELLDISEQDVISKFWSKKVEGENKTIKELFDEAQTKADIKKVEKLVNKLLVSISGFSGSVAIKNHIKNTIIKKKEKIILNDFKEDIKLAKDALDKADNFQDLLSAKGLIMDLHERRKSIRGDFLAIDLGKEIKEMIKNVDEKIDKFQKEGKDDILAQIEKNSKELKLYIESITYGTDLSQIYNLDIWKETMKLLEYLSEEDKKNQKNELLTLISKRSSEILKEEKKEEEKKELKFIERKEEIEEEINILIKMLETVHTIESINEMKDSDALSKKIDNDIMTLPTSVRGELEIKYKKAFKDRIFYIRRENIKEKGVVQNLDESGIDTMLYYIDTEKKDVSWKLIGKPTAQGLIKLEISLDDGKRIYSGDNFFEDSDKFADILIGYDIKFEITQSEYLQLNRQLNRWENYGKAKVDKLTQESNKETDKNKRKKIREEISKLKSKYSKARHIEKIVDRLIKKEGLNPRSHVPEVNHNYIVLDEEKQSLKTLSGNLLTQKKRSGIAILEGGPGLGKTVMCEYLAAVTNREIVRVQCSKKISYSEFFFAPTLKKGETSHNPAEWIKMMQKPGTIILFDEIDKLNAECMAGLHALFDSGRHVHDPQLGDFYANPDCLFLGTMNSYEPLPKAIASRATIQKIDYPSEINEAYKISKYVDNDFLNSLNYEEFKDIRANQGDKNSKTKNSKEHKINEILYNIGKLLQVFKLLRAKYNEEEFEKFEYELSYRDAAQIFAAYNINNNFKKAVSDILVSKASSVVGTSDQKEQRDMVIEVIKKVFG